MCKLDIKAIRNEYENLSLLVEKENNTASEKDLTAMAKSISNEDFQQIFSEQHGGIVGTITKSTDNAVFVIIWNIEDETMTLLPLLK